MFWQTHAGDLALVDGHTCQRRLPRGSRPWGPAWCLEAWLAISLARPQACLAISGG